MLETCSREELLLRASLTGNRIAVCALVESEQTFQSADRRTDTSAETIAQTAGSVSTSEHATDAGKADHAGPSVLVMRTSGSIGQTLQLYHLSSLHTAPTCTNLQVPPRSTRTALHRLPRYPGMRATTAAVPLLP